MPEQKQFNPGPPTFVEVVFPCAASMVEQIREIFDAPTRTELSAITSMSAPWKDTALEEIALRIARLKLTDQGQRREKWAIIDDLKTFDAKKGS